MTTYAVQEREKIEERSSDALPLSSAVSAEATAGASCAHYWIIEPADGPVSRGMCQICLEEKDFKNFVDTYSSQED